MKLLEKIAAKFQKASKVLTEQPTKVTASYKNVQTDGLKLVLREGTMSVEKTEKLQKVLKIISTIIVYAFLAVMAIIILFPFYWMLITSLKTNDEIRATQQTFWPTVVMWSNYSNAMKQFDFPMYLLNTLVVGIFSTLGTLITTIFAAFAFARLNFKGKDILFAVLLATMMIPGEMMVITNYITVATFGWIENQTLFEAYASMIVPFWVSVFYIYLLRQNFKQIPNELYLAAKVDGKSDWSFLWKVMVPLAAPTLISITILKFMGTWNSYVWPQLVTENDSYRLISNGLRGSGFTDPDDPSRVQYGYQMAATVLVTVPLFLLFVFFRKYIMKGVGRAGIKG